MNYAFRVRKQLLELMQRYIKDSDIQYTQRHDQSVNNAIINCFAQKIGWQRATLDPTGKYYRVEASYRRKNDNNTSAHNVRPKKSTTCKNPPNLNIGQVSPTRNNFYEGNSEREKRSVLTPLLNLW